QETVCAIDIVDRDGPPIASGLIHCIEAARSGRRIGRHRKSLRSEVPIFKDPGRESCDRRYERNGTEETNIVRFECHRSLEDTTVWTVFEFSSRVDPSLSGNCDQSKSMRVCQSTD